MTDAALSMFFLMVGAVVVGNLLTVWFVLSVRTYRIERRANRPAPYWSIFGKGIGGLILILTLGSVIAAMFRPML